MRNVLLSLLVALLATGLVVSEAAAKRFGGGRSFGVQRSKSSLFSPYAQKNTHSFNKAKNTKRWGGILGGVLVGGLLASLFMGHGLGSGLLSWLIVGGLVFFVASLIRKRSSPVLANVPFRQSLGAQNNWYQQQANPQQTFDSDAFLRDAKVKFMRLQAAYDQKNLNDLSSFTAPEVFAEIKMQLQERGHEPNYTEIVSLSADLLDVSQQADSMIASVRFSGTIKENSEIATSLDEIWHFRKFSNSPEWVVGGIQQEVHEV